MKNTKSVNFRFTCIPIAFLLLLFSTLSHAQSNFLGTAVGSEPVHGCTLETAIDRTGESTVELDWTFFHSNCMIVSPGTTVNWNGNFDTHPLAGGISSTIDFLSPISIAGPNGMVTSVAFDTLGVFPYFCQVHTTTMTGVIYVDDVQTDPLVFKNSFESP